VEVKALEIMAIIVILICVSVAIAVGFLGVFFWSLKSGQYDDTYTPSVRMLFDDKPEKTGQDKKSGKAKPDKNHRPS
jgi:cbb3-type cytochrome oxidase maturation protein